MANDYIALPRTAGVPSTQTMNGLPGGMNLADPPHMLDDTQARYMQDIILDIPGLIRRRGAFIGEKNGSNVLITLPGIGGGVVSTYAPDGTLAIGAYYPGNMQFYVNAVQNAYGTKGSLPSFTSSPYPLFDAKAAHLGGAWIGITPKYQAVATNGQTIQYWRGGISSDYNAGTISFTRGSTAVTGATTLWNTASNVTPGMFLFAATDAGDTNAFIGVVQSVNSATSITLEKPAPYTATAKTYNFTATRQYRNRVAVGTITTSTTSPTVTGANTKFRTTISVMGGTWDLYRMDDDAWIGRVSSTTNQTSLTLTANAAVALNNERYYAISANFSAQTNGVGFVGTFNSTYAGRQWFANNPNTSKGMTRIWFSDTTGPEDVDISAVDGNWIDISASSTTHTPIMGIASSYNALLVFKENETFGIFGNTPDTFNVQKVSDDGTLSTGSIQNYDGGVIWAGRNGIYNYDGVTVKDLAAQALGAWWKRLNRDADPTQKRMWSAIAQDHYFLYVESGASTASIWKGNTQTTPTTYTIVINLKSGAITLFSNFRFRGATALPGEVTTGTLFLANNNSGLGAFFRSNNIFGIDTDSLPDTDGFICDGVIGGVAGPDFYLETKRYDGGDSSLLKLWTNLVIEYRLKDPLAVLNIDTIPGIDDIAGTTIGTTLVPNAAQSYQTKRARFLKRDQHFGFRIWQANTNVGFLSIGPYQLGFRNMRPGRV